MGYNAKVSRFREEENGLATQVRERPKDATQTPRRGRGRPNQGLSESILLQLTPEQVAQFDALAAELQWSRSQVIREAATKGLKRIKKKG